MHGGLRQQERKRGGEKKPKKRLSHLPNRERKKNVKSFFVISCLTLVCLVLSPKQTKEIVQISKKYAKSQRITPIIKLMFKQNISIYLPTCIN